MKMKIKILNKILFLVLLFSFITPHQIFAQDADKQDYFSVLVLSDIHISGDTTKDERLNDLIEAINQNKFPNLDLLITTGDNVSSFQNDRNGDKSLKNQRGKKFVSIISKVKIPFYITLGNHDYKIDSDRDSDAPFSFNDIDTMEVLWKRISDVKPYYSFQHKGWNFIILNSMRGRYLNRFFDDEQMAWFEKELQKDMPALVFFHHPIKSDHAPDIGKPYTLITKDIEPEFFRILSENENKIKGMFAGHVHMWFKDVFDGEIPVYVTDSYADNESSPYRIIEINTESNTYKTTQNELIEK